MPRKVRCTVIGLALAVLVGGTAVATPMHPRYQGPISDSTDLFSAAWDLVVSYWFPGTNDPVVGRWMKDGGSIDPGGYHH